MLSVGISYSYNLIYNDLAVTGFFILEFYW